MPARYAVGYVVDEHSALEDRFVVRARHAHAWARVHVDGTWQELDTTPSTWLAAESEEASPLQPLLDLARPIALAMAPGGTAILSGILSNQAEEVAAHYLAIGFNLSECTDIVDWTTLILTRNQLISNEF